MSDSANTASSITTLQKIILVLGGVIAPLVVVYFMITSNAVEAPPAVEIDVANNIKPLAQVEMAPDRSSYVEMSGEEVVNKACNSCHGTGLPGIPKIGDAAAWGARIAQGYDTLVQNATNGIRMMPARGGNPDLTDLEMARAVAFMANQSGADFTPPEPAAE